MYPDLTEDTYFLQFPVAASMSTNMHLARLLDMDAFMSVKDIMHIEHYMNLFMYTVEPYGDFTAESMIGLRCAIMHRAHAALNAHLRDQIAGDVFAHMIGVLQDILSRGEQHDWDQEGPMVILIRPILRGA